MFRHISSIEGEILDWSNIVVTNLSPTWQHAYNKLVSNLAPIAIPVWPAPKEMLVFVATLPLQEGSTVWQFKMTRAQRVQQWLPSELTLSAKHAFWYNELLAHLFHSEPPRDAVLTQLVLAPNRNHEANKFSTTILGSVFDPIGHTIQYIWRDGSEIFSTNTRQHRLFQSPAFGPPHIGPHKWIVEFSWLPHQSLLLALLWAPLWKNYWVEVENCFL